MIMIRLLIMNIAIIIGKIINQIIEEEITISFILS